MDVKIILFALAIYLFNPVEGKSLEDLKEAAKNQTTTILNATNRDKKKMCDMSLDHFGAAYEVFGEKIEYGEFIYNATVKEIEFVVDLAKDRAKPLPSSDDIIGCLETKRQDAKAQIKEAYSEEFTNIIEAVRINGDRKFHRAITDSVSQIDEALSCLKTSVENRIAEANSMMVIADLLESFGTEINRIKQMMVDVIAEVTSDPLIKWERSIQAEVEDWRTVSRNILTGTIKSVNSCFPPKI